MKGPASVVVAPPVVTVTVAGPAACAGASAVIDVGVTSDSVALWPSNATSVAPTTKAAPEIVTAVPPSVGPAAGEIPVGTGAATSSAETRVSPTRPPLPIACASTNSLSPAAAGA